MSFIIDAKIEKGSKVGAWNLSSIKMRGVGNRVYGVLGE